MSNLIVTGGYGEGVNGQYAEIDWSKKKHSIVFRIDSFDTKFDVKTSKVAFRINTHKVNFDIQTFMKTFNIKKYDIKFRAKCQG